MKNLIDNLYTFLLCVVVISATAQAAIHHPKTPLTGCVHLLIGVCFLFVLINKK